MDNLLFGYSQFPFGWLIALLLLAAALFKGAAPERYASAIIVAMIVVDQFYHHVIADSTSNYWTVDSVHFAIDLSATVAFAALAMQANRIYPICLLAWQIISMSMHFDRVLSPLIEPRAYATLTQGPFYLQLATIGAGLVLHIQRTARYGNFPSWRRSSHPSSESRRR